MSGQPVCKYLGCQGDQAAGNERKCVNVCKCVKSKGSFSCLFHHLR
uniref:Uncharacterized protein n=1 Tax=Anguilla anguilla TaxID=7936 RepID=A0A0E9Q3S1_ANGAN